MKAVDVVLQLYSELPSRTDKFTANVAVTSINSVGLVATAITSTAHNLSTGSFVTIFGSRSPAPISSITRSGTIATANTTIDHDLTFGHQSTIEIEGANESEFNGTFTLSSVPNRRTFTFPVEDSGPASSTGAPVLLDGTAFGYNGLQKVTVLTPTSFTYPLTVAIPFAARGAITASIGYRISAAVRADRAVKAYTKQETNDWWLFVVLGDVVASKNRHIENDSIEAKTPGTEWRQKLIYPVSVYAVAPATDSISGRTQRDEMEDIAQALTKSLLGIIFDNGWAQRDQYQLVFNSHGFRAYDTSLYVHEFNFQTVSEITIDDTADDPFTVAFRDIGFSMDDVIGEQELTVGINLDDEPLTP